MEMIIDSMIEIICDDFFIAGDYTDFAETQAARKELYDLYWDNELFKDIRFELEDAIGKADLELERQSFIYGFKKAMEIFEKFIEVKEALNIERITNL